MKTAQQSEYLKLQTVILKPVNNGFVSKIIPITQKRLEAAGCKVTTYKGNEISIKGGGTCLTRPMLRSF